MQPFNINLELSEIIKKNSLFQSVLESHCSRLPALLAIQALDEFSSVYAVVVVLEGTLLHNQQLIPVFSRLISLLPITRRSLKDHLPQTTAISRKHNNFWLSWAIKYSWKLNQGGNYIPQRELQGTIMPLRFLVSLPLPVCWTNCSAGRDRGLAGQR